jgi:hypothetical protein
VVGRDWHDITEVPDRRSRHQHAPEAIREIDFGEHNNFVGLGIVEEAEDTAEDIADFFDRAVSRKSCCCLVDALLKGLWPSVGVEIQYLAPLSSAIALL